MTTDTITRAPFGTVGGQSVERYTLRNGGVEADVLTYGATLGGLRVPDRGGQLAELTLGFDTLDGYLGNHPYFGSTVGRYANRIAAGRFTLDGQPYTLAVNHGRNHLHGGPTGFHRRVWQAEASSTAAGPAVLLRYVSPDGEEGYPGTVDVTLRYTLGADGGLRLEYRATTDAPTILSLTNHAYFNLDGTQDVRQHVVQINARRFLPVDAYEIPTGEMRAVDGTPFDLRAPRQIGLVLAAEDEQLALGQGVDICYLLDNPAAALIEVARVTAPQSGRSLTVQTNAPGLQLYTGNFLTGADLGRGGQAYGQYAGLCLEAQHLPDSPNRPAFPSSVLRPGEEYRQTTVYTPAWS